MPQKPKPPSSTDFPLSKDTRAIIRSHGGQCRNLGLWLDHCALYERRASQWELSQHTKKHTWAPLDFKDREVESLRAALARRWQAMFDGCRERGLDAQQFTGSPEWRFVTGLGAPHVLETSITLHRVYGLPVIPGSSLKGMTRAYAELVIGLSDDDQEFRRVFGSQREEQEQSGEIVFFDAIPARAPVLKLDVMNPHFGDYYQDGDTPPADWLSPVPVYFLTVEGTPFIFGLASRGKAGNETVMSAMNWLQGGLTQLGLGAKTSAGYGYFSWA